MTVSGEVLGLDRHFGAVTPSTTTWRDRSGFGNDGTITIGAGSWVKQDSGIWALDFDGSATKVACGDISYARAIIFWMKPDSTTVSIMEEVAASGISATAGTLSYSAWDNAYVNGVDTDTITTEWQLVVITSTTNVTMSAFTIGLLDATYYNGLITLPIATRIEPDFLDIQEFYDSTKGLFGKH